MRVNGGRAREFPFDRVRFLLLLVPVAIAAWVLHWPAIVRFATAAVAIIPLAGLMGEATERLAARLGPGLGGLLNATFGNAAELIIALFALFRGYDGVVKASLTGSIIGNLLLVLGASFVAGGIKFRTLVYNRTAAGIGATLAVLAAMGMLVPAIFHALVDARAVEVEHHLSLSVSIVLLATYGLHLLFSLVTHRDLYSTEADEDARREDSHATTRVKAAVATLLIATAFVAFMSEILVGAIDEARGVLGWSEVFVGVIVVAIVGNAAEHSSAVIVALKRQMDLSVGISLGSALQIALFVTPVVVIASYLRAEPMDLLFTPLEVVAVVLAVLIARMVAEDGESNWLEGIMLIGLYVILGLAFFYFPETTATATH